MYILPDHPTIRNMENYGNPFGRKNDTPICPECGEECEHIYRVNGNIIGCDCCVECVSAFEVIEGEDY